MEEKVGRKKCVAMEGLIREGQELLEEDAAPSVLDAGLIAAAQRVEHYEIAAYGTLTRFAKLLGLKHAVTLLEKTLKEEEETDRKLTNLADGGINQTALEGENGEAETVSRATKRRVR
jgi:ferritin-like metal-binding protein YciE